MVQNLKKWFGTGKMTDNECIELVNPTRKFIVTDDRDMVLFWVGVIDPDVKAKLSLGIGLSKADAKKVRDFLTKILKKAG